MFGKNILVISEGHYPPEYNNLQPPPTWKWHAPLPRVGTPINFRTGVCCKGSLALTLFKD